jgi:hypothetical protein
VRLQIDERKVSGVGCQVSGTRKQETAKAKPETLRLGACDLRFRDVGYEIWDVRFETSTGNHNYLTSHISNLSIS